MRQPKTRARLKKEKSETARHTRGARKEVPFSCSWNSKRKTSLQKSLPLASPLKLNTETPHLSLSLSLSLHSPSPIPASTSAAAAAAAVPALKLAGSSIFFTPRFARVPSDDTAGLIATTHT